MADHDPYDPQRTHGSRAEWLLLVLVGAAAFIVTTHPLWWR